MDSGEAQQMARLVLVESKLWIVDESCASVIYATIFQSSE